MNAEQLAGSIERTLRHAGAAAGALASVTLTDDAGQTAGTWEGDACSIEILPGALAEVMRERAAAEGRRILWTVTAEVKGARRTSGKQLRWRWGVRVDDAPTHTAALVSIADIDRILAGRERAAADAHDLVRRTVSDLAATLDRVARSSAQIVESSARLIDTHARRADEAVAAKDDAMGVLASATQIAEQAQADAAKAREELTDRNAAAGMAKDVLLQLGMRAIGGTLNASNDPTTTTTTTTETIQ